ncbi:hypothetical protein D029_2123A, partial [Vibrio parahaemolyticus 970107]
MILPAFTSSSQRPS